MKLHGYEPPDDFNGFAFTKRRHMQLWLHNCGMLTVHKIIEEDE
jgi:hypothetical protein